jgi:SAM-dependent methyltransferase/glycosyltransferase involved in cell wall biosynthesis
MSPYADAPNIDLLDRIPLDARVVLDVGCATGALGAEYKRRNPGCRYLGIDSDPEAARVAAGRLDEVAASCVEAEPFPFGCGPFDCIIYGDVLEHLRDPWTVLRRHAASLAEGGLVLICMPNAEHWSFAERLLRGSWDYEPMGLFDRTHLRWFTWETTHRALTAAGLVPLDVMPRIFDREAGEAFVRSMEPALAAQGIDREGYRCRALPLQHVWRAARQAPVPLWLRSTMLDHIGGVSHVRVSQPMRALATLPGVTVEVMPAGPAAAVPVFPVPGAEGMARLFIFHRPVLAGEDGLEQLRALIAQGWLVLCEFDDHPGFLPAMQREAVHSFRAVHAVQTSTEPLAAVLRQHNPEVAVFPNAIVRLPEPRNYTDPNRLTLFFAGLNRAEEWPPLLPALNAAAALAGDRLAFRIVADSGLFEALQTPHKSFVPLCDYETYQDLLARSEISFMPLRDNAFNRCKSDLKFIEAAAHRVTALASPVVYAGSVEDGRTGLLFRDAAELQKRLLHLLADPGQGRALADAARGMVARERMLASQVPQRLAWYRSLWARREELHRDLLKRVPELAQGSAGSGLLLPLE